MAEKEEKQDGTKKPDGRLCFYHDNSVLEMNICSSDLILSTQHEYEDNIEWSTQNIIAFK
jgi:hypothetical protein